MSDLLDFVIESHGALERWRDREAVHATVDVHGSFWSVRGQPTLLGPCDVTAALDRQHLRVHSRQSGCTLEFDNGEDRVTVTSAAGEVVEILDHPRASMLELAADATWTAAQVGYFVGYGMWSYLLEPIVLTLPGVRLREVEPWSELGETWRRLEATFPSTWATHSPAYLYYFDARTGLQRRVDYSPEVNHRPLASHYTFEHRCYDGIPVPSARRVLRRTADGEPNHRVAGILLDVSDFRLV